MKLLVIAHRGNVGSIYSNENFPDNSFEGIDVAIKRENISGIEIDLRLTKDNHLILCHEPKLNKISDDIGQINQINYVDLKSVHDVKNYYRIIKMRSFVLQNGKELRKIINEKIKKSVSFVNVYNLFDYLVDKHYTGEIIIELKEQTDCCKNAVIELINKYKKNLNLTIHSYDILASVEIGDKTGVNNGVLLNHWHLKKLANKSIEAFPLSFYSIIWPYCTCKNIKKLIDNGKDLYIWTVDSSYHLLYILKQLEKVYDKYGVLPNKVAIITNVPDLINNYLCDENTKINQKCLKLVFMSKNKTRSYM